jgi:Fe-S oxidoreductase
MSENLVVPTMAEMLAQGKQPEVLFWVVVQEVLMIEQKNYKSICPILNRANVSFTVLGTEESCTGDPQKSR